MYADPFGMDFEFGDKKRKGAKRKTKRKGAKKRKAHGNAGKRLKRPYKKSVVRSGRKLQNKRKIGNIGPAPRRTMRWATRGGSLWAGSIPAKKSKTKGRKK